MTIIGYFSCFIDPDKAAEAECLARMELDELERALHESGMDDLSRNVLIDEFCEAGLMETLDAYAEENVRIESADGGSSGMDLQSDSSDESNPENEEIEEGIYKENEEGEES